MEIELHLHESNRVGTRFISVLCPTRGRPARAERMLESAIGTATIPDRFEIVFYIDQDDPEMEEYRYVFGEWFVPQLSYIIGPPIGVGRAWNRLAEQAKGDILMMGNDDQVFRTNGWDVRVDSVDRSYDDRIYVAWCNDKINGEKHCAFPIVSRKMVGVMEQFVPTEFEFFYHDTWLFEIGSEIGRLHYIDDVIIEHEHFTRPGQAQDDTTMRNRRDGIPKRDAAKFAATRNDRIAMADRLRTEMR